MKWNEGTSWTRVRFTIISQNYKRNEQNIFDVMVFTLCENVTSSKDDAHIHTHIAIMKINFISFWKCGKLNENEIASKIDKDWMKSMTFCAHLNIYFIEMNILKLSFRICFFFFGDVFEWMKF